MVDYSRYKSVKVDKTDKILTVTLNRPEVLNAINREVHDELEALFEDIAIDDEVAAVVLTGAGRAFSSGGDVKGMKERRDQQEKPTPGQGAIGRPVFHGLGRIVRNQLGVEQPIIAAVNGDAVGVGATIALLCDIIIASETARIGDAHVKVGLAAGDGGAVIWPLLTSFAKAKEYLITGDLINAREAERIGLVNYVVPAGEVLPKAMEMARRLANGPSLAIRLSKASVNKVLKERVNLILDTSLSMELYTFQTEDHREAARAFVEKRAPVYRGD